MVYCQKIRLYGLIFIVPVHGTGTKKNWKGAGGVGPFSRMDKMENPKVDEAKVATLPQLAADLFRPQSELIKRWITIPAKRSPSMFRLVHRDTTPAAWEKVGSG